MSQLVLFLKINGTETEGVNTFNFFGTRRKCHMEATKKLLSEKISKYSRMLNRLKHYLHLHIMRLFYCNLVNSHLSYGVSFLG